MSYYEVSSQSGQNIKSLLQDIATKMLKQKFPD